MIIRWWLLKDFIMFNPQDLGIIIIHIDPNPTPNSPPKKWGPKIYPVLKLAEFVPD